MMVWWKVSSVGVIELYFCKQRVKTYTANYQSDILEKEVKPINLYRQ